MNAFGKILSPGECALLATFVALAVAGNNACASQDPISEITEAIRGVAGALKKQVTGTATQKKQREVIQKLDDLIARLEEQYQASAGTGGGRPTRPAVGSTIHRQQGKFGKLHAPARDGKHWGTLPPRERERILQSLTDGFPAHYQGILEQYYRRLAEEKRPDEVMPPAADQEPSTPPGRGKSSSGKEEQ